MSERAGMGLHGGRRVVPNVKDVDLPVPESHHHAVTLYIHGVDTVTQLHSRCWRASAKARHGPKLECLVPTPSHNHVVSLYPVCTFDCPVVLCILYYLVRSQIPRFACSRRPDSERGQEWYGHAGGQRRGTR